MPERAVLLMAYGTPEREEDVGPYFAHIRGGRTPSPESVARLAARYRAVGGGTPLLAITRELAAKVEAELGRRVYVGMKHWHPYVGDVVRRMAADGVREVTAMVLAPHYSRLSVGGYRKAVDEAQQTLGAPLAVAFVERWHRQPEFVEMMAGLVGDALARFPADAGPPLVVFTAHSLPERIREWGDPYEQELLESSRLVAERLGLPDWRFAWQSAGGTGEPWIGPDIVEYLDTLHAEGVRAVLQVPIGFVADHLEVLYDIDIEAAQKATSLGMTLRRTEMPNARPEMVRAVAAVVEQAGP